MKARKALLPCNLEAEHTVIAGIMLDNSKLHDVQTFLAPEHFYDARCGTAFAKILELAESGKIIEPVTVGNLLDKEPTFGSINVDDFLFDLNNRTPSAAPTLECAQIVYEKARKRKYIETLEMHAYEARKDIDLVDDMISKTESTLFRMAEASARGEPLTAAQAMDLAEDRLNRRLAGEMIGMMTGYTDLDSITNGFLPGQLVVIAGRPGSGKSSFALNVAQNAIFGLETPVLFFSLEMSEEDLMDRLASAIAKLDGMEIALPVKLQPNEIRRYRDAANEIRKKRFYLDARSDRMSQIVAISRRHRYRHHVELIVVDYMQLIDSTIETRQNREQQVAKTSRRLKTLAKELGVPIIALAQINRESERQDRRPRLSDLRESGAIEQDADIVLLFHRPELSKPGEQIGEAECIVAKNRNGPTDKIDMTYLKHFTRFENAPKKGQAQAPTNGQRNGQTY